MTFDFGPETQDVHIGAGTIAAPCVVPMLLAAQAEGGRMPLSEVLTPAIAAAAGHTVTPFQARVMRLVGPILSADPAARALYFLGDATMEPGATLSNPAFGEVLDTLAHEGARIFAEGEIAAALLAFPGSHLTRADLAVGPRQRAPLGVARRGVDVALNPPPSLGGVSVALALAALPHRPGPGRLAQALDAIDRVRREAPDAAALAHALPDHSAALKTLLAETPKAVRGTTHISVIDAAGMAAGLTLSNGEGCGRILPGTGLMPNNMLGEEDLVPGGPLAWTPDRRMASMMCPMLLRAGDATTVLGTGGSSRIRTALAQVALALIDAGTPLEAAIRAPRLHVEAGRLSFEDTGDARWREGLRDWSGETRVFAEPSLFFGGVHAVRAEAGTVTDAFADPRRAGHALVG